MAIEMRPIARRSVLVGGLALGTLTAVADNDNLIGVVHARKSGTLLRVVDSTGDPDSAAVLTLRDRIPPHYAVCSLSARVLPKTNGLPDISAATLIAAIAATGGPALIMPQRCMVISGRGIVIDKLMGDAQGLQDAGLASHFAVRAGDSNPDLARIVASDIADIGWILKAGVLLDPRSAAV